MKRTVFYLTLGAILLSAAVSCHKESVLPVGKSDETVNPVTGEAWSFTASFEKPVTRITDMDENGAFAWEDKDEIKILWDGGSATAAAAVSDGVASFTPEGMPDKGTAIWLVYPADMTASLEGGNLLIGMPAVQKNKLSAFFVAKAEVGAETVAFKHPVCYYKIVVDETEADITRMLLASSEGKSLSAASLSISFDEQFVPAATSINSEASVSVSFEGAGTYYFPVVPGVGMSSGDLSFRFFRGAEGSEPAGGYMHKDTTTNVRSTILNWGSLPAKATNRYVSVEATGIDDGMTSDKAWDFAQFQKFMEKAYMEDAEAALYDGITVHFSAGTYKTATITPKVGIKVKIVGADAAATIFDGQGSTQFYNHTSVAGELSFKNITFKDAKHPSDNGGCFRVKDTSVAFEDCVFENNQATTNKKGGGVVNSWGTSTLSFKNCTFTGNYGYSYGGVLYIQGTTAATIEGCSFTKNHSANGGVLYLAGDATVTCSGCTFGDGTADGKNYANQGAALYIASNNTARFVDCVFNYNQGTANWGSCIMMYNNNSINPRLYLNRCIFENNVGLTRGVVAAQNSAYALIFMNAVSFYKNTFTDTSNAGWGIAVHCGNSVVCMNNVTACENTPGGFSKNWVVFNSDGAWLITNSTVVNKAPTALVRANNDARKTSLCNNILINTWEPYNTFEFKGKQTSSGHNLISRDEAYANFTADETDKIAVESLTDGAYSEPVYTWTNNLEAYTPADQAAVNAVYAAYDESIGSVTHIGNDFCSWLESIGALDKDGRGQTRTGIWWPGAYQAN